MLNCPLHIVREKKKSLYHDVDMLTTLSLSIYKSIIFTGQPLENYLNFAAY